MTQAPTSAAVLRLTDTMTGTVEEIAPATPGLLRVYACGPTVYRPQHVGNLRSSVLPDLILRVAARLGLRTQFVQNITDVGHVVDEADSGDDKLEAEARRTGRPAVEIAREVEALFKADGAALNLRPADAYPRATEYIPQMQTLVQRLLETGNAYESAGSVWYDARSFPGYGDLSHNRLEDLQAGASNRLDVSERDAKRFHADWALWKAGSVGEWQWDSPWGQGFPGWHLECSAMSTELLGEVIDVHTGGIDLRFPHHEDERAQSDAAVGHSTVRHWVHSEHLLFEGRKMSKSTGNVVLVADVEKAGLDPLAIRLFFLTAHYRKQADLTWKALHDADKRLKGWRASVARWAESPSVPAPRGWVASVVAAFSEDLQTARAVALLDALAADPSVPDGAKFEAFADVDQLFGLDLARLVGQEAAVLPEGAQALLDERAAARTAKDFGASDVLRDRLLAEFAVVVRDTAAGQETSPA